MLQNELKSDVPRFTTRVQTCFASNQVVACCVNTVFWLDKITPESRHTQDFTSLVAKQVCLGSVKRETCTYFFAKHRTSLLFLQKLFSKRNNLFCCKKGLIHGLYLNAQHRYSTGPAAMLLNKLHVFVARLTVPLLRNSCILRLERGLSRLHLVNSRDPCK